MLPVAGALWPAGVVTVTLTAPAAWAGATAVALVADTTVKVAAEIVPKETAVVADRPVPVRVTVVPPVAGPVAGATLVTVGATA